MNLKIILIKKEDFDDNHRDVFQRLLKEQGKVLGNLFEKVDRCKEICIAYFENEPVAIGGIKIKTSSAFSSEKSNQVDLQEQFEWELGYIYTKKDYRKRGISSFIVKALVEENININLMATTETIENPGMVKVLKKNGFNLYGNEWKSAISNENLGLFLRFVK